MYDKEIAEQICGQHGHKLSPRFDEVKGESTLTDYDVLNLLEERDDLDQLMGAARVESRIYICDVCEVCGFTISARMGTNE